jgi:hypothetical protein
MIRPSQTTRRGVLLLVVLSMLTLFLMLGVTYLVAASRARKVARAYAIAAGSSLNATGIGSQLLDEALLTVVRGTTVTSGSIQPGNDLLGDRYGRNSPEKGVLSGNVSGTAILSCSVTGLSNAKSLAGRVLTFTLPGIPGASTRIIRATDYGGAITIYFPAGRTISGVTLSAAAINSAKASPRVGPTHILVNNRDFDNSAGNEPYDAFDSENAFLAQVSGVSTTPSYSVPVASATIDNDGDGTPDSGWLDLGLPPLVDASGNILQPKAAVLVVDLDSRINLNTHGSNIDLATTESSNDFSGGGGHSQNVYPKELIYNGLTVTGTIDLTNLPRGIGAGAAEVSLAATDVTGTGGAPGLPNLLAGLPELSQSDTTSESRPRPLIGQPEGRYGDTPMAAVDAPLLSLAKPGLPNTDDNREVDRWVSSGPEAIALGAARAPARFFDDAYTRYGSPPDIKGRMRLWVDAFGQPVYFKPAWGFDATLTFNGRSADDDETIDDPYEINLGPTGPQNGWIHDPKPFPSNLSYERDTPFNAAELEGVLRFYDPDTLRLQRRMVSLLGGSAANGRLKVTSDSWDTPAVVGSAWAAVIANQFATATTSVSAATGSKPYELFSPETLMGHKLDINRPFHAMSQTPDTREPMGPNSGSSYSGEQLRQQFAKHLYCLFTAIATKNKAAALTPAEAEQIAQWAVNIVDFRDSDSIMTRFDYDENFTNGSTTWNATKRVWGCERPEILITETIAWHDRCTDDTANDPTSHAVIDKDPTQADNDFDQRRRPRGAFFIELCSPWGSQAKQYVSGSTSPVDVYRSGTNSPTLRGEPLPLELTGTATDRFSRDATITLRLRHDRSVTNQDTATGSPIWRLVSVRGDVRASGATFGGDGFGVDPVRPSVSGTSAGTLSILDPSRPRGAAAPVGTGTAVIDRIFYFTPPPTAQRAEPNGYGQTGCIFWETGTSTKDPSQQNYVVFGTDQLSPTTMTATGTFPTVDRVFNRPLKRPATLSEPIATGTATTVTGTAVPSDAYQLLSGTATFQVSGTSIYDGSYTLNTTLDQPLDGATSHPASVTAPFLDKNNNPLLMQNGRHANFAVVHLQRLADPSRAWQPDDAQANYNPYLTVDSMAVDLIVANNGTSGSVTGNLDEPGSTPFDPSTDPDAPLASALTWLQNKSYDRSSSERGGKSADGLVVAEKDIWSRKINVAGTGSLSVFSDTLFRSGTSSNSPVTYTPPPYPNPDDQPGAISNRAVTANSTSLGARPERFTSDRQPWLFWANRPFTSPAEMAAAPTTSSFHLLKLHTTGTASSTASPPFAHLPGILESGTAAVPWRYLYTPVASGSSQPSVFDFIHVPTRFMGSYVTLPVTVSNTVALAAHGLASQPYNHLSLFREPGRININTVQNNDVKTALLGKQNFGGSVPIWSSGLAWNWIQAAKQVNTTYIDAPQANRNSDLDSFFRYQTAGRLSNTISPRSNVFAVWVTVGYFPAGQTTEDQPLKRHRAFFIYDRSIPVGYDPGKNHNVRDGILLRRIIQ